ncbi:MAG TPA: NAD-dependent epimerase/dehydratase family protein, partial [Salinibacter sp.]|nr:NAD-dependent epimerase/dehydratase family protein [Salinibacter sp.]
MESLVTSHSARAEHDRVVQNDLEYIVGSLQTELAQLAGARVLITGGAGFLGYYLTQALLHANTTLKQAPITVVVLDNFMRGLPTWLDERASDPHLTIIRHDITQPLPSEVEGIDHIIHAASIASPTFYRQHPIETMDANVNGLRHLLEYARRQKDTDRPVRGFLFFSSSEIYGDPEPWAIPTPETYPGRVSCTGPRACYDESKRYGETLCVNFAHAYDLPITVARPFNNYGPGLKLEDRRVPPDFSRNILRGEDIVMLSDGTPTRTFCYVADAIVGYVKILVRGGTGEAYNIGVDGPEISIADLADRFVNAGRELFDYTGTVVYKTARDPNYLTDNPNR